MTPNPTVNRALHGMAEMGTICSLAHISHAAPRLLPHTSGHAN